MTVRIRTSHGLSEVNIRYIDAHVTFWPDGWAEVYGTVLNDHGTKVGKQTDNYSIHQSVFLSGIEKHHD